MIGPTDPLHPPPAPHYKTPQYKKKSSMNLSLLKQVFRTAV